MIVNENYNQLHYYSKHIPHILRHQLIHQIIDYYAQGKESLNLPTKKLENGGTFCQPSIQRFHCSLLFVDISGFTKLSLKLNVDELKNHINQYFTKMLDIVEKHGGEVVKFAGDALYIIWRTPVPRNDEGSDGVDVLETKYSQSFLVQNKASENSEFQTIFEVSAIETAEKAVACGREIGSTCNNHKIIIEGKRLTHKASYSLFSKTSETDKYLTSSNSMADVSESYLNVHSGVGIGLMAGIDVGAIDRCEYLLVGDPLNEVALAESQAEVGEMVVSPAVHQLIHPSAKTSGFFVNKRVGMVSRRNLLQSSKQLLPLRETSDSISSNSSGIDPPMLLSQQFSSASLNPSKEGNTNKSSTPAPMLKGVSSRTLSCGCSQTCTGYFKLHELNMRNVIAKGKDLTDMESDSLTPTPMTSSLKANRILKLVADLDSDDAQLLATKAIMKREMENTVKALKPLVMDTLKDYSESVFCGQPNMKKRDGMDSSAINDSNTPASITEEDLNSCDFVQWLSTCLVDDVVRHVHEVARSNYRFKNTDRSNTQFTFEKKNQNVADDTINLNGKQFVSTALVGLSETEELEVSNATPPAAPNTMDTHSAVERRASSKPLGQRRRSLKSLATSINLVRRIKPQSSKASTIEDNDLSAELRTVMVLFIKIDMNGLQLYVDPDPINDSLSESKRSALSIPEFNFLKRSNAEIYADDALLFKFQKCMETIMGEFSDKGGHLRQFIVDDKGTVCIGTFGLRGSGNDDNAAAAIEAAQSIVNKLQIIGLKSSIGVTSGKAYCGLVGSPSRHEYAVMGPSTNLSARLMGKAPPNEIICDVETRKRDRTHSFIVLSEVHAKGYSAPVQTFRPIVKLNAADHSVRRAMAKVQQSNIDFDVDMSMKCPSIDEIHKIVNLSTIIELEESHQKMIEHQELNSSKGSSKSIEAVVNNATAKINFLTALTSSDYVIQRRVSFSQNADINKAKQDSVTLKLHGRSSEFEQALHFLFPYLVQLSAEKEIVPAPIEPLRRRSLRIRNSMSVKVGSMKLSITKDMNPVLEEALRVARMADYIFYVNQHSKLLVLSGPQGMGKSSFVKALCQKIANTSRQDPKHNISVFYNSNSKLHSVNPFVYWKATISEMILIMGQGNADEMPAVVKVSHGTKSSNSTTSINHQLKKAVVRIMEKLPSEMREYHQHLISFLLNVSIETNSSKVNGQAKLYKSAELLAAIIQLYTLSTNKIALIAFHELDIMDNTSLMLLRHIWTTNTGVVIISSVRAAVSLRSTLSPNLNGENISRKSMGGLNILGSFTDSDRFLQLEIGPLDFISTKALICDTFANSPIPSQIDDEIIKKLHELSGGNPLYVYEILKTIKEKTTETTAPITIELLNESIQNFRSNRVEEMICKRFDQLDPASQLILKMGAVASTNGGNFSYQMLAFLTQDSFATGSMKDDSKKLEPVMIDLNLSKTLLDIINNHEFIRIVAARQSSSENFDTTMNRFYSTITLANIMANIATEYMADESDDTNDTPTSLLGAADESMLLNMTFEFKVRLEQLTIYNLLLDEQKTSLHAHVAAYMKSNNQKLLSSGKKLRVTTEELFEEGFHWQQAAAWSSAMQCYFNAAMNLDTMSFLNDKKSYLSDAYKMISMMREELEDMRQITFDRELSIHRLQMLLGMSSLDDSVHSNTSETPSDELQSSTASSIKRKVDSFMNFEHLKSFCHNDPYVFRVMVQTLQHCARIGVQLMDSPTFITSLYEEALELVLIAKKGRDQYQKLDGKFDGKMSISIWKNRIDPKEDDMIIYSNVDTDTHTDDEFFGAVEDLTLELLIGIIVSRVQQVDINNTQMNHRSRFLGQQLVIILQDAKSTTKDEVELQFCDIVPLGLKFSMLLDQGSFHEALDCMSLLKRIFNHSVHSKIIRKTSVVDVIPELITIAAHVQYAEGDILSLQPTVDYLIKILKEVEEPSSMFKLLFPLCILLVNLHRYTEALEIYEWHCSAHADLELFANLTEINMIFQEWLNRLIRWESFSKQYDANLIKLDLDSVDDFLLQITKNQSQHSNNSSHSNVLNFKGGVSAALYLSGWGLETICAHLCFMKIDMIKRCSSHRDVVDPLSERYLLSATHCIHQALETSVSDTNSALMLNTLNCYLLHAKLLMILEDDEDCHENTFRDALESLTLCEAKSKQGNLWLMLLMCGLEMESLRLDEYNGLQIQLDALSKLRKMVGSKRFKEMFPLLLVILPSLKQYDHLIHKRR